jgi:hypothetical protein
MPLLIAMGKVMLGDSSHSGAVVSGSSALSTLLIHVCVVQTLDPATAAIRRHCRFKTSFLQELFCLAHNGKIDKYSRLRVQRFGAKSSHQQVLSVRKASFEGRKTISFTAAQVSGN